MYEQECMQLKGELVAKSEELETIRQVRREGGREGGGEGGRKGLWRTKDTEISTFLTRPSLTYSFALSRKKFASPEAFGKDAQEPFLSYRL